MPWAMNLDRQSAERYEAAPGTTVCISITDPSRGLARLSSDLVAVLRLSFEDLDLLRHDPGPFTGRLPCTPVQAQAIVAFVREHRGKNILVHCEAGVSRSAAVVEAILCAFTEYEDRGGVRFPNGHVKMLVTRAHANVPCLGGGVHAVDHPCPVCRGPRQPQAAPS